MMRKPLGLAIKVGSAFVSVILTPLIILNFFSGIAGGIWLAIIGQWWTIGLGFLFGFLMPYIYAVVSLPGLGLGILAVRAGETGNKLPAAILGFMASVFHYVVIAIWCFFIFSYFAESIGTNSPIPYLLWIHSTTMAPLGWMASKEPPENTGTSIALVFAQLNFFALAILWLLSVQFGVVMVTITCLIIAFSLTITILTISMMSTQSVTEEEMWRDEKEWEEGEEY